ncbi:putative signal peptide protein [Puccinia sorghi]|uniref:Putative signal peptide protein n=1 Tax=Puccinia sorghi TaxID=27349 RepID=A0A0L6VBM2_9BASI|nr:putative signal peptide protein [Puccinia sorghi]
MTAWLCIVASLHSACTMSSVAATVEICSCHLAFKDSTSTLVLNAVPLDSLHSSPTRTNHYPPPPPLTINLKQISHPLILNHASHRMCLLLQNPPTSVRSWGAQPGLSCSSCPSDSSCRNRSGNCSLKRARCKDSSVVPGSENLSRWPLTTLAAIHRSGLNDTKTQTAQLRNCRNMESGAIVVKNEKNSTQWIRDELIGKGPTMPLLKKSKAQSVSFLRNHKRAHLNRLRVVETNENLNGFSESVSQTPRQDRQAHLNRLRVVETNDNLNEENRDGFNYTYHQPVAEYMLLLSYLNTIPCSRPDDVELFVFSTLIIFNTRQLSINLSSTIKLSLITLDKSYSLFFSFPFSFFSLFSPLLFLSAYCLSCPVRLLRIILTPQRSTNLMFFNQISSTVLSNRLSLFLSSLFSPVSKKTFLVLVRNQSQPNQLFYG